MNRIGINQGTLISYSVRYVTSRNNTDKPKEITPCTQITFIIEIYNKFFDDFRDVQHRKNLPSFISSTSMGWYKNGERHNTHGPAHKFLSSNKGLYYIKGRTYRKAEWELEIERLNYKKDIE